MPAYRFVANSPFTSVDFLIIIAFIASVVIISISHYTLNRQASWKSKIPVLISSGIGLGLLLEFQFPYILKIEPTGINVSGFWSTPFNGLGFWGTVSGFAIASEYYHHGGKFLHADTQNLETESPVLVSIGIGFGLLFSFYIHFYLDQINHADVSREFNLEIIERSIKFGSWGTVIGFIVAAVGMFLTKTKRTDEQVEVPGESG